MSSRVPSNPRESEKEAFHWSFDEIRNIFVKTRNSGDREQQQQHHQQQQQVAREHRSTSSFKWSLSSTFDVLRTKFSFGSGAGDGGDQRSSIDISEDRKKMRMDEDDRELIREAQREARHTKKTSGEGDKKGKKCEKEKDRRNYVNSLFYKLGELVGLPGVKSKTEILDKARAVLKEHEAKELEAMIMHDIASHDIASHDDDL